MEEKPEILKLRSDLSKVKKEIERLDGLCDLVCLEEVQKKQEELWSLARETIYDLRFALNVLEFSLHNSKKCKK